MRLDARISQKLGRQHSSLTLSDFPQATGPLVTSASKSKFAMQQPLLTSVPEEKSLGRFSRESQDRDASSGGSRLPAEAPPPVAPFKLHAMSLKNLVSAGLDMKSEADNQSMVQPLMQRCGGSIEQLASMIHAPLVGGLREAGDADARRKAFGENRLPEKELPTFWELCLEALEDETLRYLCVASIVSIILGTVLGCAKKDWIEGFAIIVAVIVVVIVTAANDYSKERQFAALSAVADDRKVLAYRNGSEQPVEVGVCDVMVGDLLYLRMGDKIPADCYYLSGSDVKCSESSLTGESDDVKKGFLSFNDKGRVVSSPFLFGGTQVVQGNATAMVLAVGPNTISGSAAVLMQEVEPEAGPMQSKLDALAELIGKMGLFVAVVTFVVLMIRFGVSFAQKDSGYQSWENLRHWSEIVDFIVIAITVLVVAIPEGLPLAVTISLAFSVKKMMNDNNLVRNLSSCETMGAATTICSDKTGTLTTNNMTVMRVYVCDKDFGASGDAPRDAVSLSAEVLQRVFASVIFNCDAATSLYNETGARALTGNKTELALLKWVEEMNADYRNFRKQKSRDISSRIEFPFSSDRKRMSAVLKSSEGWTLYTKGASEIVLSLCTHVLGPDGAVVPLSPTKRDEIDANVIKKYADDGLRTICVAYRPLGDSFDASMEAESVEHDLIMVAITGIEDPVRSEVPRAIEMCRKAGIDVRMVTGDNIATARSIARKCGILTPSDHHLFAMEGPEFRAKVLGADGSVNQDELDKIWPNLRVLARSSPMDKHTLVSGIMNSSASSVNQVVAVTGDGTNDAPALRKADVGFAMGIAGTEVAKEACDIIVLDDNFSSIVAAVKWGRGVYDNICKFIQFQLTVNLVAIIVTVVGSAILKESPMRAIQLLWINLLMDSLASLALATEEPNDSLLNRQPYGRKKPLLSKIMCRNILFHAIYQIAVLFYFIYGIYTLVPGVQCARPDCDAFAEYVLCNFGDQSCLCGNKRDPSVHYCMVFNCFVCMTLFNEINMRKLSNTRNVFQGIFSNPVYWWVTIVTCICQALIIQFGGAAFGTAPLSGIQWLTCIAFGAGTLVWHQIILCIPCHWIPNGDDQDDGVTTQIGAPIAPARIPAPAATQMSAFGSHTVDSSLQLSRAGSSKLGRKSSRRLIVAKTVSSLESSIRGMSGIGTRDQSDLKM